MDVPSTLGTSLLAHGGGGYSTGTATTWELRKISDDGFFNFEFPGAKFEVASFKWEMSSCRFQVPSSKFQVTVVKVRVSSLFRLGSVA